MMQIKRKGRKTGKIEVYFFKMMILKYLLIRTRAQKTKQIKRSVKHIKIGSNINFIEKILCFKIYIKLEYKFFY